MLLRWLHSQCSCHCPCLRHFRTKPSTSVSPHRAVGTSSKSCSWADEVPPVSLCVPVAFLVWGTSGQSLQHQRVHTRRMMAGCCGVLLFVGKASSLSLTLQLNTNAITMSSVKQVMTSTCWIRTGTSDWTPLKWLCNRGISSCGPPVAGPWRGLSLGHG